MTSNFKCMEYICLLCTISSRVLCFPLKRCDQIKLQEKKQHKLVIPLNRNFVSEDSRKFTQAHWHNRSAYTSAKERQCEHCSSNSLTVRQSMNEEKKGKRQNETEPTTRQCCFLTTTTKLLHFNYICSLLCWLS